MEIEVEPDQTSDNVLLSNDDDNDNHSSYYDATITRTMRLNDFVIQWENESEPIMLKQQDESNGVSIAGVFGVLFLLAMLGLCALLMYTLLKSTTQRHKRSSRKKPSSRSQLPFRLNRANSSFADIYRDLRSENCNDTGLFRRIRSATSFLTGATKPQRPSSMDISDNIQRFYLDSDADRVDRDADESLFARVLEQDAVAASLHQAPDNSFRQASSFDNALSGPTLSSVQFRTWIPPPSWAEASRNFIANQEAFHHLARNLSWKFAAEPILTETVATKRKMRARKRRTVESSVPIAQVRLEVHRPVEMGVLYIHRDDMIEEHSFRSAQAAAQFQTDVTMLQACGASIYCLFQALVIAQNGSHSSSVTEPIFNCEKSGEDHVDEQGIAWADVMQCLGNEMPCIQFRLDALLYMEGARQQESVLLKPEYQRKRLLLGPIDFFRLFVPTLPHTAVPISDSNRLRTEHVLRVRKRVALAAVLVHSFVTARCVVNRGWQINGTIHRKRRMAFDDAIDNEQYDLTSQKEYYETNQKQGYSLVGIHSLPWNGPVDPVLSFRSLRALVEEHPHLHFMVQSFYTESQEFVTVYVYIRSLASDIDPSFDSAVKTFAEGDKAHRDSHLQIGIQLGVFRDGLSVLGRVLMMFLSVTLCCEIGKFPRMKTNGTTFPTLSLSAITARTLHFGGCLCTNESLPNNYIAYTAILGPQNKSLLSRLFLLFFELGIFSKIVSNVTMDLVNCKRPLSTVRLVRDPTINAKKLNIANAIKTAFTLFFSENRQYNDDLEVEDLQGSFGDCSLASYSAERHKHRDALGDATRHVLDQIGRSRDLAFLLDEFRVEDVRRFLIDSNGKVKVAVSRLTSTALWRREVFPVDIKSCRVELQSGQLFSYGQDNEGCPVMYFRNMCLGPWRKNVDATISAALHRFDTMLSNFAHADPNVKLTVIVLLGRPLTAETNGKTTHLEQDDTSVQGTADSTATLGTGTVLFTGKNKLDSSWNPRVKEDELWYAHTDQKVVQRLIEIVRNHYPGRLHRILLVSGSGFRLARSAMGRQLAIRRAVPDPKLRNRIVYISRSKDIQRFVEPSQIPGFAGGTASTAGSSNRVVK